MSITAGGGDKARAGGGFDLYPGWDSSRVFSFANFGFRGGIGKVCGLLGYIVTMRLLW
jgi:hypothetical protein